MAFEDIVNSPEFGRQVGGSTRLNAIVNRYLETTLQNMGYGSLLPKIQFSVDKSRGRGVFRYTPFGDEVSFSTLEEAVQAAIFDRGTQMTRTYSTRGSYHSGAATNPFYEDFQKAFPNHKVRLRSFSINDANDVIGVRSMMEENGIMHGLLTFGGDGAAQILDIIDPQGKRVSFDDIMAGLKLNATDEGSVFKRLKIFTNDRTISRRAATDAAAPVYLFDTEKVFGSDKRYARYARARASRGGGSATEIAGRMRDIYESMSDGAVYLSQGASKQELGENVARGYRLINEARRTLAKPGLSSKVIERAKEIERIGRMIVEEADKQTRLGSVSNVRIFNATDAVTGDTVDGLIKGNQFIEDPDVIRRIIELNGADSNAPLYKLWGVTSARGVKKELTGGISRVKTIEAHGVVQAVNSDILTWGTNRDYIGSPEALAQTARKEIEEGLADLRSGKMSGKLMEIVRELETWEVSYTDDLAARQEAKAGQMFARQIRRQLEIGGNIADDPVLMGQMHQALIRHYTKFRKGKYGKTLQFEGNAVDYMGLSFPIPNSLRGEIAVDTSFLNGRRIKYNTIANQGNSLVVDAITWSNALAAFGGADLDDNVVSVLKYDPKARRLMAFTYRNPNQMGEYQIFNAHISMDRSAPAEIRRLWMEQEKLLDEIRLSPKNVRAKISRVDQIRDVLHKYYMSRSDIGQIDPFADIQGEFPRLFAPKGYQRITTGSTYSDAISGSFNLLGDRGLSDSQIRRRIFRETEENGLTGFGQLFRFVGDDYNELMDTGFFKPSEQIDRILRLEKQYQRSLLKRTGRKFRSFRPSDMIRRAEMEETAKGLLGKEVNVNDTLMSIYRSTMDYGNAAEKAEFVAALRENPLYSIARELSVDTIKKTGNKELAEAIEDAVMHNARTFGQVIGRMHKAGFIGMGIDPIDLQTRLANDNIQAAIRAGYAAGMGIDVESVTDQFLIDSSSPRAFTSSVLREQLQLASDYKESSLAMDSLQNLQSRLSGIEFTPEELTRAQDVLEAISSANKLQAAIDAPTSIQEMEAAIREAFASSAADHPNTVAMRMLHGYNFQSAEAMDRQVLAMAQVAVDNGIRGQNFNTMRSLGIEGIDGSLSITDLYHGAMQRMVYQPEAIKEIQQMTNIRQLRRFIGKDGFTSAAGAFYDPMVRNKTIMDQILTMAQSAQWGRHTRQDMLNKASFILSNIDQGSIVDADELSAYSARALDIIGGADTPGIVPAFPRFMTKEPARVTEKSVPGIKRATARARADAAADAVLNTVSDEYKPMKRLDQAALKEMWQHPMFRKGIIGFGIFAGFGLVHRMTKDPTPEDIKGPPLLPGGSPYEDYDPASQEEMSSMYSSIGSNPYGGGILYTVRANGDYDTNNFSNDISGIANGSVIAYQREGRRMLGSRPKARQILNSLMEGNSLG